LVASFEDSELVTSSVFFREIFPRLDCLFSFFFLTSIAAFQVFNSFPKFPSLSFFSSFTSQIWKSTGPVTGLHVRFSFAQLTLPAKLGDLMYAPLCNFFFCLTCWGAFLVGGPLLFCFFWFPFVPHFFFFFFFFSPPPGGTLCFFFFSRFQCLHFRSWPGRLP